MTQTNLPYANFPPPRRSWWSRNWMWAAPLGCLLPILACGGTIAVLAALLFSSIHYSEPFRHAMDVAGHDQRVVAILGKPIHSKWSASGNITLQGTSSGGASFSIPVYGPNGAGTLVVSATKRHGKWTYQTLRFVNAGNGQVINLLPGAIVQGPVVIGPPSVHGNS